jgi:hypothetical protein
MSSPRSEMTLAERFAESNGKPIPFGRQTVYLALDIPLPDRCTKVRVVRQDAKSDPVQGVCVKVTSGGKLKLSDETHNGLVLWSDTTAAEFEFEVIANRNAKPVLRIWNCWRSKFGGIHAWIGNSGLTYQSSDNIYEFACSDGAGNVSFDAIRFVLRLEPCSGAA